MKGEGEYSQLIFTLMERTGNNIQSYILPFLAIKEQFFALEGAKYGSFLGEKLLLNGQSPKASRLPRNYITFCSLSPFLPP